MYLTSTDGLGAKAFLQSLLCQPSNEVTTDGECRTMGRGLRHFIGPLGARIAIGASVLSSVDLIPRSRFQIFRFLMPYAGSSVCR